ncbi:hypothetical protein TYRP_006162 [Tyrophagus putrescentiae]|nr:hypothetical protein TYRP_006162 [Tyrophagus putrescentiae]
MSTTLKTALQGGSEMRRTDAAVDISTTRQIVTTAVLSRSLRLQRQQQQRIRWKRGSTLRLG